MGGVNSGTRSQAIPYRIGGSVTRDGGENESVLVHFLWTVSGCMMSITPSSITMHPMHHDKRNEMAHGNL